MTDQIEELIREIAAKHDVAVSRDDPILILQTMNNRLLEDSARAHQAQLDRHKEELEAIALRWGSDAKEKSERILNASLAAGKDVIQDILYEGARTATIATRAEIDTALAHLTSQIQDARGISMFNVIASCMTLVAATILLWSAIR